MASFSGLGLAALLLGVAGLAAVDLHRTESATLVVYTTSALQDFLEKAAIPAFTRSTGISAVPVYVNAADEYYRVALSRDRPEADVFVHASPLYIEKGFAAGLFEPIQSAAAAAGNGTAHLAAGDLAGNGWRTFAWSPLVEVYSPRLPAPPDLAAGDGRLGLAHPLLSNNGVYVVLFFEALDPAAGQAAVARTVVQPTNARATIGGVADGSYDATIGYEAVANFYKGKGAKANVALPAFGGHSVTTPVLFVVGTVARHPHPGAEAFVQSLFSPAVQDRVAEFWMRPVLEGARQPEGAVDLAPARVIHQDWSQWQALESRLSAYEVRQ